MAGLAIDAVVELAIGLAAAEALVGRKIVAHTIGLAAAVVAEALVGRQVEIGP
jgi:hypothetical protein